MTKTQKCEGHRVDYTITGHYYTIAFPEENQADIEREFTEHLDEVLYEWTELSDIIVDNVRITRAPDRDFEHEA